MIKLGEDVVLYLSKNKKQMAGKLALKEDIQNKLHPSLAGIFEELGAGKFFIHIILVRSFNWKATLDEELKAIIVILQPQIHVFFLEFGQVTNKLMKSL